MLSIGAKVVSADITAPVESKPESFLFVKTDVSNWADLTNLFKKANEQFGRIDSVFANAGVGPRADYLTLQEDADGNIQEPTQVVYDIMLKGVINTASLAVHYMKKQPEGGSIVLMGSSTGLQPLRAPDYCKSITLSMRKLHAH